MVGKRKWKRAGVLEEYDVRDGRWRAGKVGKGVRHGRGREELESGDREEVGTQEMRRKKRRKRSEQQEVKGARRICFQRMEMESESESREI